MSQHTISLGWGQTMARNPQTLRTWQCSCGRQGSVVGTSEDAVRRDATAHVNR